MNLFKKSLVGLFSLFVLSVLGTLTLPDFVQAASLTNPKFHTGSASGQVYPTNSNYLAEPTMYIETTIHFNSTDPIGTCIIVEATTDEDLHPYQLLQFPYENQSNPTNTICKNSYTPPYLTVTNGDASDMLRRGRSFSTESQTGSNFYKTHTAKIRYKVNGGSWQYPSSGYKDWTTNNPITVTSTATPNIVNNNGDTSVVTVTASTTGNPVVVGDLSCWTSNINGAQLNPSYTTNNPFSYTTTANGKPETSISYILCMDDIGSKLHETYIYFKPTVTVSANPSSVNAGEPTVISWSSDKTTDQCSLRGNSSPSPRTYYPTTTEIYTPICTRNLYLNGTTWVTSSGSASTTVAVNQPNAILSFKLGQEKNLVRAIDSNQIGTTYLEGIIGSLPAGVTCNLYHGTTSLSPGYGNGNFSRSINNLSPGVHTFQIKCSDNTPQTVSNTLNVYAQSGTLSVASCTIPIGGSTCPSQTISWTTISPDSGSPTAIFQNNTQIIQTSNNGSSSLILNGNGIPNGGTSQTITFDSRNRVDGETTGSSIPNTLDIKQVTVSCASGSTWVDGECLASTVDRPDLTAGETTPSSAVVNVGRTYTTSIRNQGTASTGIGFQNSFQTATGFDDPTLFLGAINLQNYTAPSSMSALGVGASATATSPTITFPNTGNYYMRACADIPPANPGTVTNESNEGNNCGPWTVITVASSAKPDLTAGETTPSSAVVNVGRTYTTSIRNQGTASTGIGFQNSFQTATGFDDPTLFLGAINLQNYTAPSSMSALGVGASATATSPTITFPNTGNYYMRACADIPPANPGTVTNESNEGNNCGPWIIVSVGVSDTVDLRASAPTQNTATIGVPMNFTSTISNQGNTVTENSFYNTFQVATEANGGGILTRINSTPSPMPALAPGGLATATSVSHTFTGLPTTRSVRACADMNSLGVGRITETNETNNCSAWTNVTFPGSNTTGTISATNCTIASGASTCRTTLNWNTVNPVNGGISAVTTSPDNTIVRTGLSGTNYDYEISQGNHPFYLYHSLPVSTLLAETVANATCVLGTAWIDGKCTPSTVSGNLTIIPNSCIIQSGESTCTVKGATWTTNNAIKPALIDVNTGSILSNLANNSEPLEVWVSYPQTVFNLTHDGTPSVLDTEKVDATCVLGTAWIDGKCTPSTTMTGSLSATPNPCIIASGSSTCNTTLSWAINNTEAIPSEITANGMAPLSLSTPTIGGNYSGTRTAVVTHPSRTFFLYNNGKSLVPADGSGVEVRANCASGTVWDGSKCSPSGGVGIDGMCGFPHNDCDAGTSFDLPDSVDTYMWRCLGESGGEDSGICTEDISGGGGGVIDITFEAKPKRILKGRSSTLTWTSNAEKCLGSTIPEGGEFDTGGNFEGSLLVKPNSTTTYVLTCSRGENSAVAEAEVKVSVIKFFEI